MEEWGMQMNTLATHTADQITAQSTLQQKIQLEQFTEQRTQLTREGQEILGKLDQIASIKRELQLLEKSQLDDTIGRKVNSQMQVASQPNTRNPSPKLYIRSANSSMKLPERCYRRTKPDTKVWSTR
jgi:hypothetical protein